MSTRNCQLTASAAGANRTGAYLAMSAAGVYAGVDDLRHLPAETGRGGRDRAVSRDPHPHAGSGDLHRHRHRDGDRRRQDRSVSSAGSAVFVGTLTALSCAAFVALPFVAGTGPGAQAWFIALIVIWSITSSALRAPPLTLLGKHRAEIVDPVPVGARDARLRCGRRGVALSRRGAAQSGRAASLRDFERGPADHRAGVVQGRARSRARTFVADRAGRSRNTARQDADDLHRVDGHSRARLSTAFQYQQRAILPAFRKARRSSVADAGVLDRLQYRDVSGQRQSPNTAVD